MMTKASRWRAVRPLRHRDYRLLWTGLAVALIGSGLWLVALAWQVIDLGGGPVELSIVTTAYSVGLVFVLFILGPLEVLLPFAVRDQVGGGAGSYGLVLAVFGVSGAVGALLISSRPLPRRYLTVMTLMWALGSAPFALLGVANEVWQMAVAGAIVGATGSAAMVIWGTLLQRRVPDHLRGRIASLDFFVSLLLMPVSMALAGPAAGLFGVKAVFVAAGIGPVVAGLLALWLGRMRADEIANPLDRPADEAVEAVARA